MSAHPRSRLDRAVPRPVGAARAEAPWVRRLLIGITVVFLTGFVVLPLCTVVWTAFGGGIRAYLAALGEPTTCSALRLTLLVAAIAVPCNVVFGMAAAWSITRFQFRGKRVLLTLIDLPFAVSPVIVGLIFVLLFGARGALGPWLEAHHLRVIFAVPGLVLVTTFVTIPFVARELIPALEARGPAQEIAALTLGASAWQTFWRVTLPNVRWPLIYGAILCTARAVGEFGAVSVVSGHIQGRTTTLPLEIELLYNGFQFRAAFAVSTILIAIALCTLALKSCIEWHVARVRRRSYR